MSNLMCPIDIGISKEFKRIYEEKFNRYTRDKKEYTLEIKNKAKLLRHITCRLVCDAWEHVNS